MTDIGGCIGRFSADAVITPQSSPFELRKKLLRRKDACSPSQRQPNIRERPFSFLTNSCTLSNPSRPHTWSGAAQIELRNSGGSDRRTTESGACQSGEVRASALPLLRHDQPIHQDAGKPPDDFVANMNGERRSAPGVARILPTGEPFHQSLTESVGCQFRFQIREIGSEIDVNFLESSGSSGASCIRRSHAPRDRKPACTPRQYA